MRNKMVINTSKSHYRQCNASVNTRFSISIADAVLERRNKSRLLVFTINVTLYQGIIVCLIYVIEIRSNVAILQQCPFCFSRRAVINGSTIIFCSVTSYITVNTTEFHSEFGQAAKYYGGISKDKKKSYCVS